MRTSECHITTYYTEERLHTCPPDEGAAFLLWRLVLPHTTIANNYMSSPALATHHNISNGGDAIWVLLLLQCLKAPRPMSLNQSIHNLDIVVAAADT
eukprot:scaffold43350_cov33-Prasinocladus_malaysianus.AAC.2